MSQRSTKASTTPGSKDGLFFLTILMNMRNKPDVDWDLVAQVTGYKDSKCASTRYGQLKKKYTGEGTSAPTTPSASFTSTSTVANTPTPSPSKGIKRELGSGKNLSAGRVKKTPVKGNGKARGPNAEVSTRLGEEEKDNEAIEVLVDEGSNHEDSVGEI